MKFILRIAAWWLPLVLMGCALATTKPAPGVRIFAQSVTGPFLVDKQTVFDPSTLKTTNTDLRKLGAQPRWSPDGKWIAYLAVDNGRIDQAGLVIADSSGHQLITLAVVGSGAGTPAWSPDGNTLAYYSQSAGGLVIEDLNCRVSSTDCVDPSPGKPSVMGWNPTWSFDGKSIAYEALDAIHILNLDSGVSTELTLGYEFCQRPDWSPKEDKVVLGCYNGQKRIVIVVDLSLPETAIEELDTPGNCTDPVWSPDAKHIAMICEDISGSQPSLGFGDSAVYPNAIYVADLNGHTVVTKVSEAKDESFEWVTWFQEN